MAEKTKRPGILFCLSGPSGVGKDTLIRELQKTFPELRHSISLTTRPPRGHEEEGVHYYFTDRENFENLIAQDEIVEYDEFCGHYYGTPLKPLVQAVEEGVDLCFDITVKGSLRLKQLYPEAVLIFIMPPSRQTLLERLQNRRTEALEVIQKRLAKADHEFTEAKHFDYLIINDTINDAVSRLEAIVTAERHRTNRQMDVLEHLLSASEKAVGEVLEERDANQAKNIY